MASHFHPTSVAVDTLPQPAEAVNSPKMGCQRFYRPELDGLRFFAFLSVFLFHSMYHPTEYFSQRGLPVWLAKAVSGSLNSGGRGVDLFFVLSAYLITELLLREKQDRGALDVKSFYVRRVLRIWPLYYFFLAIATLVPFLNPQHAFSLKYVVAFLALAGNWSTIVFGPTGSVAEPLWSVSVEEQFYLTWPLIVARLSRRGIMIAALTMVVAANCARFFLLYWRCTGWQIWANTFTHLDAMAGGILLAILLRGRVLHFGSWFRFIVLTAATAAILSVGIWDEIHRGVTSTSVLLGYPLVALSCTSIVFAVLGMGHHLEVSRYLGTISYGLYVYHLMCIRISDRVLHFEWGVVGILLRTCAALGLTILISAVSYRLLEAPFLNLKRRFTHIHSRPV